MVCLRNFPALVLLASTATLVYARDPSADELDAVEQAFIDAGLVPDVIPEMALEAFYILTFTDADGNEVETPKTPGASLSRNTVATIPSMATQGIHHLKGSRLVAFVIDPDEPMSQFRTMFAQNLSVREDSPFSDVDQDTGSESIPCAGPHPRHRFAWLAYKQPAVFEFDFLGVEDRTNFNVAELADQTGLGLPVAATFFTINS